jgi:hypothetical protein
MSKSEKINEGIFGRITLNKVKFDNFCLYLRPEEVYIYVTFNL